MPPHGKDATVGSALLLDRYGTEPCFMQITTPDPKLTSELYILRDNFTVPAKDASNVSLSSRTKKLEKLFLALEEVGLKVL